MNFNLSCFSILFLSCLGIETDSGPSDHSQELNKVYETFSRAYADKDIGLIEAIYVSDAVYLTPGDTIKLHTDDFIPGFADMFHRAEVDGTFLKLQFQIRDRQQFPSHAIDAGYYRFTRSTSGEVTDTSLGKFITVLSRQEDGSWKFTHDGYSDAPQSAWSDKHHVIAVPD